MHGPQPQSVLSLKRWFQTIVSSERRHVIPLAEAAAVGPFLASRRPFRSSASLAPLSGPELPLVEQRGEEGRLPAA